jgi:transposase
LISKICWPPRLFRLSSNGQKNEHLPPDAARRKLSSSECESLATVLKSPELSRVAGFTFQRSGGYEAPLFARLSAKQITVVLLNPRLILTMQLGHLHIQIWPTRYIV